MATPLSTIRKYQKVVIPTILVASIVAFCFDDVRTYFSGGGGGSREDPVVVTTRFGKFKQSDLERMRNRRAAVNYFFREVSRVSRGTDYPDLLGATDEDIVTDALLAQEARDYGIQITPDSVNQFIMDFAGGRGKITDTQVMEIIDKLGNNSSGLTQSGLFDAIGEFLLTARRREMAFSGVNALPPAERWDMFQRFERRVEAEVLPVSVDDFTEQVPDPPESELRAFFEKYRENYPLPGSPEPGFRAFAKASFEYIKADHAFFLEQAKPTVTDEEVKTYYDQNKARLFPWRENYQPPAPPAEPSTPAEGNPADPPAGTPPSDPATPPSDGPGEGTPPADPATPPGATPPGAAPGTPPANTPPCSCGEAQPETPPAESDPSPPASQDPARSGESPPPVFQPGGETPPAGTPPVETPPATPPGGTPTLTGPLTAPIEDWRVSDRFVMPPAIDAGPRPLYDPLWRVESEIRDLLAQSRARTRMMDVMAKVKDAIDHARYKWIEESSLVAEGQDKGRPKVDFAQLAAKEPGLSAGTTPLLSLFEMREQSELGKTFDSLGVFDPRTNAFESVSKFTLFDAESDDATSLFVAWKTDETEAKTPELESVRGDVVTAWKRVKARELAAAEAQRLAGLARAKPDFSLRDSLPEFKDKVADTGLFSWLVRMYPTGMGEQAYVRLGEVKGVDTPGEDFMKFVSQLAPNEVGVAPNFPQSVSYVVRLTKVDGTEESQRMLFARFGHIMTRDLEENAQRTKLLAYLKSVEESADVHWERPPTAGGQ